jgi:hypothetical protein
VKRISILAPATLATLALLAAACSSGGAKPGASGTPTQTASGGCAQRLRSSARLEFVQPAPGASVPANNVHVKLNLVGGKIVPGTSCDVKPNEGHVHIVLDDVTISVLAGLDMVLNDIDTGGGKKVGTLAPGLHRLQAQFVDAAHVPFEPPVQVLTTFRAA